MNLYVVLLNSDLTEGRGPMTPVAYTSSKKLAETIASVMPGVMAGPGENPATRIETHTVFNEHDQGLRLLLANLRQQIDLRESVRATAPWAEYKEAGDRVDAAYQKLHKYLKP